jgi:hypothetical protein
VNDLGALDHHLITMLLLLLLLLLLPQAAIVSQESSAMWVGTFDFEALEFTSEGVVYNFPRDNHCDVSRHCTPSKLVGPGRKPAAASSCMINCSSSASLASAAAAASAAASSLADLA